MNKPRHHMALLSATFTLMLLAAHADAAGQGSAQRQRLEQHVYTLAADSLQGRRAGSADAERAAAYVVRQWRDMGLQPLWGDDYRSTFTVHGEGHYTNLVAIIEGCDPILKGEYIVVGGHYDHLGVRDGKVYNGADDNASGTACVTEVARQLLARQKELKRSVIICAFDAEEIGLYGSDALARNLAQRGLIDRVQLMMSVDMVGWLRQGGGLTLEGTGTLQDYKSLVDPESMGLPIKIKTKRYENSIFTATDTEPFAKRGVPTLAVTTGIKSPYHKPEDDANLIDYEGLSLVTDYVAALTLRAAERQEPLPSGQVAPKHRTKTTPLSLGVSAGYHNSWLRFPNAAFNGKSLTGGDAGLALQYNMTSLLSLHTDIHYSYTRATYPDMRNLESNTLRLQQHSLTVPLMLQLKIGEPSFALYLGFGGYYSHSFSNGFYYTEEPSYPVPSPVDAASQPCRTHQWGFAWNFGIRLGYNWQFSITSLYQMGSLFTGVDMPLTRGTQSTVSLTYYFF